MTDYLGPHLVQLWDKYKDNPNCLIPLIKIPQHFSTNIEDIVSVGVMILYTCEFYSSILKLSKRPTAFLFPIPHTPNFKRLFGSLEFCGLRLWLKSGFETNMMISRQSRSRTILVVINSLDATAKSLQKTIFFMKTLRALF